MALTTGKVDCLNIGDDFGFVGIIEDGTGDSEAFIIWFAPSEPSAFTRVLHSMWLSMLREALTTGDQVQISHADDGAFILGLRVNKSP
jgi:hypothetical protein